MRRRFHGNTGKADEELQSILNRRSRHLEDWEEAMAKEEVTDQEKVNYCIKYGVSLLNHCGILCHDN